MSDKKKFTKEEWSWILYDFAGSSYTAVMSSVFFPVYVSMVSGRMGDVRWGLTASFAALIMAVLSPLTGSLGDRQGRKKKLFHGFLILGLLGTAGTVISRSFPIIMTAYVISAIGFSGSGMVYDAFLTDVTEHERLEKVSLWGYAAGFLGGRTVPLLLGVGLLYLMSSAMLAIRLTVWITVFWWAAFSAPFLIHVHQKHYEEAEKERWYIEACRKIKRTGGAIAGNRRLRYFLLAYFFYMDGFGTILRIFAAYGTALGLEITALAAGFILMQLSSVPGSWLFGRLSRRLGSIHALLGGILIGVLVCLLGSYMGFGLEQGFLHQKTAILLFAGIAVLTGLCQGALLGLSRACFSRLIPKDRSNEYFGFFHVLGRFAAVLGPAMYALLSVLSGRSSVGMLGNVALFLAGGAILFRYRKIFF